jgi:prepilin-type processing-associated H-X9-DG protein
MSPLNNEQKQLLFDYCIGLTSQKETAEAEALISSNKEAAKIHSKLKAALTPLDSLEPEPCPDELVEHTIWRVNKLADSSQRQLQQLLAGEQARKVVTKSQLWWNLGKIAAAAAVFMLIVGVLVPVLGAVRQKYWRQQCQMQMGGMGGVFQGLSNYMSDYDGQMPAVATIAGAPWWWVGNQGRENHSNTRHIFLLVKEGYVDISNFACPGCKGQKPLKLTDSQIKRLKDFPSRRYVTYSFQIRCHITGSGRLLCRKVLMADWNPLFEKLPKLPVDFSRQLQLQLNRKLLTLNSINHNRGGQNVMFGDGHVTFLKTRFIGIAKDDIFTLQDTDVYQGCEVPSCEADSFLAP